MLNLYKTFKNFFRRTLLHYFVCPDLLQTELVHRHIQKEFWRVQDVLEGLHKRNSSRGTDTAKHRGSMLELDAFN